MYEVFINNNRLIFDHPESEKKYKRSTQKTVVYDSSVLSPKLVFDMFTGVNQKDFIILSEDPERIKNIFFKKFKQIEAAGGLVTNSNNRFLLIFRNGKWDLPKGKIEKGEKPVNAAIREVEEETGVGFLEIVKSIGYTYHCYVLNGNPILKKTFWYEMKTSDSHALSPQIEEGITEVLWANKGKVTQCMKNSYVLVIDLFDKYFSMSKKSNIK